MSTFPLAVYIQVAEGEGILFLPGIVILMLRFYFGSSWVLFLSSLLRSVCCLPYLVVTGTATAPVKIIPFFV